MKQVAILVPERSVLQAVADPQYCLQAVNQFLIQSGKAPLFQVQLVGLHREVRLNDGRFSVHTDRLLHEVEKVDLIFIPALFGDLETAVAANQALVPWLVAQYNKGAELASLCLGAFLLAATGLLKGKKCSTHWNFISKFRNLYPDVAVQEGLIVTEENGIYTSGGAHSYWRLLLHLVEKFTDRQTAVLVAKYFAVDIDRHSQSAFAIFRGQKEHEDEAIKKAQEYIEQHVDEKITIEDLAGRVAVGRRSFERRFRQATCNSVLEYMQRVKIEAAKRQFETGRKTISEVMYEVGYTDTKAFRTTFKKVTGLTPIAYRNKYNKSGLFKREKEDFAMADAPLW